MSSNLTEYRASPAEQKRVADLFTLLPATGVRALDIGARDCYLAKILVERFERVVALDLERPQVEHPAIDPVAGSVTCLPFEDNQFDAVLCAEVLEHIPEHLLATACSEISRVARGQVVIGVPYRQDLRSGRTTCQHCGKSNPPWGHVSSFDEAHLRSLFGALIWEKSSFVGTTVESTNWLSAALLDYAGNPFGTWRQDEACVHCGSAIGSPAARTPVQRIATRLAFVLNSLQARFVEPRGNWIHVLFSKPSAMAGSIA
ncbi:MAG: class I SAM-dependent methyltransferase [Azonexus sp.]|nr:class I SAM-dependent methyltransferase [Azonexus sp.]